MKTLSGYRTIIAVAISLVLKVLAAKGVIGTTGESDASLITDGLLLLASGVSDLLAIWFRLRAEKPGQLSDTAILNRAAASEDPRP